MRDGGFEWSNFAAAWGNDPLRCTDFGLYIFWGRRKNPELGETRWRHVLGVSGNWRPRISWPFHLTNWHIKD